jgi:hypothetical protein
LTILNRDAQAPNPLGGGAAITIASITHTNHSGATERSRASHDHKSEHLGMSPWPATMSHGWHRRLVLRRSPSFVSEGMLCPFAWKDVLSRLACVTSSAGEGGRPSASNGIG